MDNFDVQAGLLINKCKERSMQSSSGKINFGDPRWIECKRSITTNGAITSLRLSRRIRSKFAKFTSKSSKKSSQSKAEKHTSPGLEQIETANGYGPTSSLSQSLSSTATDSGRGSTYYSSDSRMRAAFSASYTSGTTVTARPLQFSRPESIISTDSAYSSVKKDSSNPTTQFGGWGALGENLPSPIEQLSVLEGISFGSIGKNGIPPPRHPVSEDLITPTTVNHPRPPIPPKNFSTIPAGVLSSPHEQRQNTAPPPIPRRSFNNPIPFTNFSSPSNASISSTDTSCFSSCERHKWEAESNTPPPALPPRRIPTLPVPLTLAPQHRRSQRPLPSFPLPSPQVAVTSFRSTKKVNSTPELLNDVQNKDNEEEDEGGSSNSGSMFPSTESVKSGIDRNGGIGKLKLPGFRTLPVFSRSDESSKLNSISGNPLKLKNTYF
ncbi:hypothetical protein Aperf_G00000024548 [Anoplocephala perfoliata]